AAYAARRGLPFAALRAVCDDAASVLPRAAAVGLKPDGSPAVGRVILALLRRPSELTPLLAIARDSRAALAALGATVR
ncbi:MAG: nucleoside phosphorylase, partial [Acetobacteraceae bacterium]|nr:nucleoside phosphorylase [Acetobacteraceae bacterium]